MTAWTWALLAAALFISWLAWVLIRESEGTLGGLALARWGVGLSLFFGIYYGLYLAGNALAVKSQAEACAAEYLDLIKEDKLPLAFLRTIKPSERPAESGDLESAIEYRYNMPRGQRDPGHYTTFRQAPFVQFIRLSGQDARFKLKNSNREYTPTGYVVTLTYDVESVVGEFELRLAVHSVENAQASRQWHIMFRADDSQYPRLTDIKKGTADGARILNTMGAASTLVRAWVGNVQDGRLDLAYLDTVPPSERPAQQRAWALGQPIIGMVAGPGALIERTSPASADFHKGRQAFTEGKLVSASDMARSQKSFPEIQAAVRRIFSARPPSFRLFQFAEGTPPFFSRDGQQAQLRFPIRMMFTSEQRMVECEVLVGGTLLEDPQASEQRVIGLRILRELAPPAQHGQPR
jgi:hypothetical protein